MRIAPVGMFFVSIAFFVAPFLWSYVASLGGFVVRAVDISFIFMLAALMLSYKFIIPSRFILTCFIALLMLTMLRAVIFSEPESLVSAVKITFYLTSAIACTSFMVWCSERELQSATNWALLFISPFYFYFGVSVILTLGEVIASGAISSPSQFIFRFWNSIFSINIFGSVGLEELKGVAFRNTGGIAFLVLSLFFFWIKGRPSILFAVAFVIATLFFSRSVWICQLVFVSLLVLRARGFSRLFILVLVGAAASVMIVFDHANEAVSDRIESDIGRFEMIDPALEEMDNSFLLGSEKGAGLFDRGGITTDLHNVPLSFGLKSGFLGLLFASLIPAYFAVEAARRTINTIYRGDRANENAVAIVLCLILFLRPLISASHDVYFSVGEWLALSLFFAIKHREELRKQVNSCQISTSRIRLVNKASEIPLEN